MPTIRINGAALYHEIAGDAGDPLVLVQGSWVDHHNWDRVVPGLSRSFRVLTYDRRGHSLSERPTSQGSVMEDVEDLAALIKAVGLALAHVAGNSFGAIISLQPAITHPELVRTLIIHEPPLVGLVAGDPEMRRLLEDFRAKITAVMQQLSAGDIPGGTRRFVEEVALGPGVWDQLPSAMKETFTKNAPTFLDEIREPTALDIDLGSLSRVECPTLITRGDQSPPWFPAINAKLASAIKGAQTQTFTGAGHIPHFSHPAEYVESVTSFIASARP